MSSAISERPVDLVHLSRQTLGDRELEREVLDLFERQSLLMLERLKNAANAKSWNDAAHTLKGSARGVGAFKVAEVAEEMEMNSDDFLSCDAWIKLNQLEARIAEANGFIGELRLAA